MTLYPSTVPLGPLPDLLLPASIGGHSPADLLALPAVQGGIAVDFLTIFSQSLSASAPQPSPQTPTADPQDAASADNDLGTAQDDTPLPQVNESPDFGAPLPFWALPSRPDHPSPNPGRSDQQPLPTVEKKAKPVPYFAENAENPIHLLMPVQARTAHASSPHAQIASPVPQTAVTMDDSPVNRPPSSAPATAPKLPAPVQALQAVGTSRPDATSSRRPEANVSDAPLSPQSPAQPIPPDAAPTLSPNGIQTTFTRSSAYPFEDPAKLRLPPTAAVTDLSAPRPAVAHRPALPIGAAGSATLSPAGSSTLEPPIMTRSSGSETMTRAPSFLPQGQPATNEKSDPTSPIPAMPPLSQAMPGLPSVPATHAPPPLDPEASPSNPITPMASLPKTAPFQTLAEQPRSAIDLAPNNRRPAIQDDGPPPGMKTNPPHTPPTLPTARPDDPVAAVPSLSPTMQPVQATPALSVREPTPPPDSNPAPPIQQTLTAWPTPDAPPDSATPGSDLRSPRKRQDGPTAIGTHKSLAKPAPLDPRPLPMETAVHVAPDPIATDLPLADRAQPRGETNIGKTALPQSPHLPTALPDLVIRQILPNIGSTGAVSVTLAPVELGTLRFEVTSRGEGLHLHLMVDAPATLDLLRRQGDQILAELRQAGFAQASLSFAPGGGQSGAGSPGGDAQSGGAGGDASPPPAQRSDPTPLHRPAAQGLGLLDLRL